VLDGGAYFDIENAAAGGAPLELGCEEPWPA
jgi:hypothetical protein